MSNTSATPPEGSRPSVSVQPAAPVESPPDDRYVEALRRFSGDVRMARQVWESMGERGVERTITHHRLWLDALLSANLVDEAAGQVATMQGLGFDTDPETTWRLALRRAQGGDSTPLDELARTTPPPPAVLPRLFGLQVRAGRLGPARATLRLMSAAGVAAGVDDYRPVLADILSRNAIKDAEALVDHLLAVGAPPSPQTAARLAQMMARSGHPDRAEGLVERLAEADVDVGLAAREALVEGWARANDIKGIRRAIAGLEAAGGTATSHHHNVVLGTVAAHGDLEGAWNVALDMLGTAIPSGANLDRMLELALKRRDIVLALSAWDWMVMLGVPPAANRAADMVGVVLRDGQLDLAMELYREAIRLEVTPDRRRGEELAAALVDRGDLEAAAVLLNELRVRKVLTKGQAWGPLLAGLVRAQRHDAAVGLVTELVGHGIAPTVSDTARTASGLTRAGELDRARLVLETAASVKVGVDEATYRELLWAYARKGRGEQAAAVLALMTAAGITPDERHEKAIAWATGETQRRLPDATPEGEQAAGEAIVAAKQTGDASAHDGASASAPAPGTPSEPVPQPLTPQPPPQPVTPAPVPEPVPQPLTPDPAPVEPEPTDPPVVPDPVVPDPEVPDPMPNPVPPEPDEPRPPEVEPRPVDDTPDEVVTTPDPVVRDEEAAMPGDRPDPDPVERHAGGDETATTPAPLTPAAHEQAPVQPDLDDGTATPDPDKDPTTEAPADDAIQADKLA